ncbi:L,D-transpeptidase [Aurantimonas sp. C2-6-R+9]|uniref:L,D-transpeptidase n=2 Tax=root TaxID=1 RepID=A0A9C9NJE6_9HYPH|nr:MULTISPECIES: L,D-transpeptidase [unclassified Aurantimonas]MEC5291631.1 L,D-transpeptidase [Aurantimonas sp. C2-3-R2]MEC5322060.1 L,D-transpeptidase [Aurantimonas sp. A3-2-R12]MEC5381770.1 L,D-transpeptidase [Aurantimonas sp. C2-6-R+9]MEC5412715.1 L,D-transpeptidase [Aurantimonas sp. C2-4-R8]HDZ71912.1 L,D-transpeptidase [Aurantimonas coralicida]
MTNNGNSLFTRRKLLLGFGLGAAAVATGCTTGPRAKVSVAPYPVERGIEPKYVSMYGPVVDDGYRIPAVDLKRVDPKFYRQEVADPTGEAPGTVVVDTANYFAYVVMPGGRAMRYGVGIGRAGFSWSGRAKVQWKRKWPTWTPPREMIAREPSLAKYADGMEPGLANPLGSRALYIFQGGKDTLYRLHGTPEYWTIGTNSSSGCIRFMNQDAIDLYDRVKSGSPLVVTQIGMV